MPRLRFQFALAFSIVLATTAASAQIPSNATGAFRDGNFLLAATLAEADGSADALAYAARARIAEALARDGELCRDCLLQAETAAQEAVARDPHSAEAYVQLALALGFRGRLMSIVDAQTEGIAEKGHAALEKALELEPGNNWARAALGAWHLEIVRRGGPVAASVLYGASKDEGLKLFRAAVAMEPGNVLLRFQFALSILALDVDAYRNEALQALPRVTDEPTDDALTRLTRRRAETLRAALREGDDQRVAALVRQLQGYPNDVESAAAKQK